MADVVYTVVTVLCGLVGVWAFLGLMNVYIAARRPGAKRGALANDPFKGAGWSITAAQFKLIRYAVYALIFGMILYQYTLTRQLSPLELLAFLVLIAVTTPDMPKVSIIPVLLRASTRAKAKRLNNEVLLAFIHLKNLSLIQADLNAYEILRKLLRQTKELKPYLADVVKSWHATEARQAALTRFEETVGTSDASNFVKLLYKLDAGNIGDLTNELNLYEQSIFETRQTEREVKNGQLGDMFFTLATFELMAVLFNFIMVVILASIQMDFK